MTGTVMSDTQCVHVESFPWHDRGRVLRQANGTLGVAQRSVGAGGTRPCQSVQRVGVNQRLATIEWTGNPTPKRRGAFAAHCLKVVRELGIVGCLGSQGHTKQGGSLISQGTLLGRR